MSGVAVRTDASVTPTRDRLWTPQFLLLLVGVVFMYMSTVRLTPTLPLFVTQLGAGPRGRQGDRRRVHARVAVAEDLLGQPR